MFHQVQAIANEFDSYLQDRAQRLGYQVRMPAAGTPFALPPTARLALVQFHRAECPSLCRALAANSDMRDRHDRGHYVAWAEDAGALVQLNAWRGEACGQVGARAFAEQFFADEQGRSLSPGECGAYLDWLVAATGGPADTAQSAAHSMVTLAVRLPATRQLALVRLASAADARAWVNRARAG